MRDGVDYGRAEWLLERLGDFWSVLFCLLKSTIVRGFLSVLLSVLLAAFPSCLLHCGLFGLQMACH